MTFHEMVSDWFDPVPAEMLAALEARIQSLEQRVLGAEQAQTQAAVNQTPAGQ
jgi:hypothetical protein